MVAVRVVVARAGTPWNPFLMCGINETGRTIMAELEPQVTHR